MSSLHHLLSSFGLILQERLFPALEQKLCEKLSPRHKDFVAILGLVQLDGVVGTQHGRGRRRHDRAKIARALVAKAVWALPTTRSLLDRLGCDASLRLLCGWESDGDVPDETVFSRAFAEFASSELPQRIHAAVVKRTLANQLIGHIARDASAIEARQRVQRKTTLATPKIKSRPKRNSAEPKPLEKMTRVERQCSGRLTLKQICDELPRQCDAGCKNNSRGNKSVWVGYKLHLDVSDGHIPISALLTAASLHDSQAAVPLAMMTAQRVTSCYDLMDSAYDSWHIREHSIGLGHVPIIEPQKRGAQAPELAPHQRKRFRARTMVERVFSRLKDEFGGRSVRVRGAAKVMAHLMFGIVALTADHLLRLHDDQLPSAAMAAG